MSAQQCQKIRIGISSCLLGEQVRYDGGHRYDALINTQLAGPFIFLPFCPETAIGLGVPRDPIQLVKTDHGIRVRASHDPNIDVTRQLESYGKSVASEYTNICGYIFKARSPSCGIENVTVWTEQGNQARTGGSGAFAATIVRMRPDLPVTDEVHLHDPVHREQFIERVMACHRQLYPERTT